MRDGCTVDAMTPGDSEATLSEPIEIDPVTALETTARETVDEAASYIAAAIEAEDAAHAKALYALAAGVLKTAATAVAELRKEAARQGPAERRHRANDWPSGVSGPRENS